MFVSLCSSLSFNHSHVADLLLTLKSGSSFYDVDCLINLKQSTEFFLLFLISLPHLFFDQLRQLQMLQLHDRTPLIFLIQFFVLYCLIHILNHFHLLLREGMSIFEIEGCICCIQTSEITYMLVKSRGFMQIYVRMRI